MSTTGVFGFRINNQDKVTFNGSDSYPRGLGASFLGLFIEPGYERMKDVAEKVALIDEEKYYRDLNFPFSRFEKQARDEIDFPDEQKELLKPRIYSAYIMNFDSDMFETYSGLNPLRSKKGHGRYSSQSLPEHPWIPGVNLIYEMSLLNIDKKKIEDYVKIVELIEKKFQGRSEFLGMDFYKIEEIWKKRYEAEQIKSK
jgi:hypothetical protein